MNKTEINNKPFPTSFLHQKSSLQTDPRLSRICDTSASSICKFLHLTAIQVGLIPCQSFSMRMSSGP